MVLAHSEWSGRRLSQAASGIYLNRSELNAGFDGHAQQRITSELPALDALLNRSVWQVACVISD
ncbi:MULTISPECIES: hypothetical protein [unclassified Pantoea]|uniref:hypothetical protein n=1 Tax=unclassified Pantoea TaxID=2630326 RepID=UPI00301CC275